jgi:hypothetical protein
MRYKVKIGFLWVGVSGLLSLTYLRAEEVKFSEEPALSALVEMVKRDADQKIMPFFKMKRKAQARFWLPQLKLGIDRAHGSDLSVSAKGDGLSSDVDIDQTMGYSADLSWNLPGIVYNADVMNAYKEELRLSSLLRENLFLLYELYGKRQELLHKNLLSSDEKRELFTVTSRLNVLASGAYDQYLENVFAPPLNLENTEPMGRK